MSSVKLSDFEWVIGSHISYDRGITNTLKNSITLGLYAFQFFLGSPKSVKRTKLDQNDIDECLLLKHKFPTKIFSHFPYICNLAGSKNILAWSGDETQDQKTLESIYSLQGELDQIAKIRGQGVVLHPGCSVNKHKGCGAIAESINKLEFVNDSKLILENMAGQGSMIGSTLEELCLIRNAVIPEKRPNVGFCIDTAHIWGKGLYDISKVDEIDKMFQDIDSILGIQNLCLFHLNDSKKALGSNVDRHELIGEGEIWSGRMDVFKYFLNRAKEWGVPCIMETEPEDIVKIYSM